MVILANSSLNILVNNPMNNTKKNLIINSTVANSFKQPGSLAINATIDWDHVESIGDSFASLIDASVISADIGADLHRWQLDFDGVRIYLFAEENSASLWLELDRKEDQDTLDYIEVLLGANHG